MQGDGMQEDGMQEDGARGDGVQEDGAQEDEARGEDSDVANPIWMRSRKRNLKISPTIKLNQNRDQQHDI